jgi:hypothetical protein
MLSGEATNTNFIVFGLTPSGLEPTVYRTRGEHANHCTTNAVLQLFGSRHIALSVASLSRAFYSASSLTQQSAD